MATAVDSTRTPAVQARLLPLVPFVFRPSPPVDDPRSTDELLEEIAAEIDRQAAVPKSGETLSALKFEAPSTAVRVAERSSALSGSVMGVVSRNDTLLLKSQEKAELPPEPLLPAADHARTLHLRRQLEAAAEYGADLLAALGWPRLVGPDFVALDPVTIGDEVDCAIAALDALDGDSDLEESADDEFTGDDELSLGWTNVVRQLDLGHASDDGEPTLGAPERHPHPTMWGTKFFEPANGSYRRVPRWHSQASWAQGSRFDGEGEECVAFDGGEDTTPDEDGLSRPWLAADRVFGMRVAGDCCAPHILDGGAIHVDKEAAPKAGDFVAIWFEGWRDNRYGMHGWVKRLSMNLPPDMRWPFYAAPSNELVPVLMVEALNPPGRYMLDVTKVHAVFKVVNILPPPHAVITRDHRTAARR